MTSRAHQLLAPPFATLRRLYPGTALCGVLALAGSFLAEHYAAPALMLVLLLGFGFANQAADPRMQVGVSFCSRHVLRIGVALLGARIGVEQLLSVGSLPPDASTLNSFPLMVLRTSPGSSASATACLKRSSALSKASLCSVVPERARSQICLKMPSRTLYCTWPDTVSAPIPWTNSS
ncbi:putative sulfate exporter family transporter [Pseudomonas stutzeri]|uniref:putative sulfate exporter family transporter n=1 Tax=Stutzerimonas stutzeri TaxID=316 RepID=UPI00190D211D|nr:putative sulfate exporter family transporter [Stutzerimonas stutzeri]MBK3868625.1 putative sulfate exporter family transporter [Stutzerimonas stutzeri]